MEKRSQNRTHSGNGNQWQFSSRLFPRSSIEVSTDFPESEKVRRRCRFGQNLPLRAKGIQPENLSPFTSVQWRPTAAETSDWRKSRCNKIKKQHTDSRILPVCMLFWYSILIFYRGGIFWNTKKKAGGKLRSLQKNQSVFSTTCQYPSLSGPIRRSAPSAFSLAICFSTVLRGIPIRWQVPLRSVCYPVKAKQWFSPYFYFLLPTFCIFLPTSLFDIMLW